MKVYSPVVALVQARMNSSRFPGKMMEKLQGKPILEWVLRRVRLASSIDEIILATTDQWEDEVLVDLAKTHAVEAFRGSSEDVLERFCFASRQVRANTIVRICADNPLVDPLEIDRAVLEYRFHNPDYSFNHIPRLDCKYPNGLGAEVFSEDLLEMLNRKAKTQFNREHVTSYIWENRHEFVIRAVPCPKELKISCYESVKLDIDVPEDLERLQWLCEGLDLSVSGSRILQKWRKFMQASSM